MIYTTPNGDSFNQLRSRIQAVGVALLFTYTLSFACQGAAVAIPKQQKEKSRILAKLLQTSRVLYLYAVAVIFSTYPPFFQGTHSAVMAWVTFAVLFFMHLFCFLDIKLAQRSIWSYMNTIYHCFLVIWFFLIMGFTYTWFTWS